MPPRRRVPRSILFRPYAGQRLTLFVRCGARGPSLPSDGRSSPFQLNPLLIELVGKRIAARAVGSRVSLICWRETLKPPKCIGARECALRRRKEPRRDQFAAGAYRIRLKQAPPSRGPASSASG